MVNPSNFSSSFFLAINFSICILLLLNLFTNLVSPIWVILTLEFLFFSIIVVFFNLSVYLIELTGYLIAYSLILSVAIESAVLLAIILIINKILLNN